MPPPPRKNAIRLESWLRRHIAAAKSSALPPTRRLGEQFHVSHATVHRLLRRLEEEGLLWRAENGRCYARAAKRYIAPLRPMACFTRKLGGWSVLCREVMEGFADACAEQDTPLLLVHSRELLAQKDPYSSVKIATPKIQAEILRDFLRVYGGKIGGLLLDELWCDEAIESVKPDLPNTVVFHRSSRIVETGNVTADFESGALMGLSHLLMNGYESLVFIDLFGTYEPARTMLAQARKMYRQLGGGRKPFDVQSAASLKRFIRDMGKQTVGFFCTDDNSALFLLDCLKAEKRSVPEKVGVISTMGTRIALDQHLTTLRYDFRGMGKTAAAMLLSGKIQHVKFTPQLFVGNTTRVP